MVAISKPGRLLVEDRQVNDRAEGVPEIHRLALQLSLAEHCRASIVPGDQEWYRDREQREDQSRCK